MDIQVENLTQIRDTGEVGSSRGGMGYLPIHAGQLMETEKDVAGLLATLDRLGFSGTFALQGFGLKEPPAEHLARSMAAWWKLAGR